MGDPCKKDPCKTDSQEGCVSIIGNVMWDRVFLLYSNSVTRVQRFPLGDAHRLACQQSEGISLSLVLSTALERRLLVY